METTPSPTGSISETIPLLNKPIISKRVNRRLYLSHFLSTWNARVFEFGAVMYLASIFPGTLLPMSAYAFTRGLSAIIFAPFVGQYIDSGDRLQVVRVSIVGQRLAVAASTIVFYLLSIHFPFGEKGEIGALALLAFFACIGTNCSIMNMVSIEKDWVVVIASKDQVALRELNAQMRRIDLICKLLGPLFISIIDSISTEVAIIINFTMNTASIAVEYYAIARVFHEVPELQHPKSGAISVDRGDSEGGPNTDSPEQGPVSRPTSKIQKVFEDFMFYFHHRAFLPSFAGSIAYLMVLNFGTQMVTYLLSIGYTSLQVGLARTVSVICEIMATWVAPWLMSVIGPVRAGLWMGSWQLLTLGAGTSVFIAFTDQPNLSATGLIGGVILSRVGRLGFNLCIQIIVQEEVEAESRGAFSTIEAAMQNAFDLLSFITTMIFFRPEDFIWPALITVGATATAVVMYAVFVRIRRDNPVHLE